MTPEDFERTLSQLERNRSAPQDAVLRGLREQGATISQAIKAVRQLYAISLGEAKARVARDSSWNGVNRAALGVHQAAEEALEADPRTARRAHA